MEKTLEQQVKEKLKDLNPASKTLKIKITDSYFQTVFMDLNLKTLEEIKKYFTNLK